ncbi:hypothetical protein EON64_13445 [archaeon]|nr:MAG: hypothetical protein EON64_13445 [archaeon]
MADPSQYYLVTGNADTRKDKPLLNIAVNRVVVLYEGTRKMAVVILRVQIVVMRALAVFYSSRKSKKKAMKYSRRSTSATSRNIATPTRRTAVEGNTPSVSVRGRTPQTVHKKEIDQLSHFIKRRNHDLDEEICALRDKLRSSSKDVDVGLGLKGLHRSSSVENDSLEHAAEFGEMKLQGTALGKVDLQPAHLMHESRRATPQLSAATKVFEGRKNYQPNTDHLVTLLAKIKLSMCFQVLF